MSPFIKADAFIFDAIEVAAVLLTDSAGELNNHVSFDNLPNVPYIQVYLRNQEQPFKLHGKNAEAFIRQYLAYIKSTD